jgi:hypothetical protein
LAANQQTNLPSNQTTKKKQSTKQPTDQPTNQLSNPLAYVRQFNHKPVDIVHKYFLHGLADFVLFPT